MKLNLIFICAILLTGCNENIEVKLIPTKENSNNVKELCGNLVVGQSIEDAYEIMKGVARRSKVSNTSGEKAGTGYLTFWNAPSDLDLISSEPLRIVIPHGEICIADFDGLERLVKIEFSYVDEKEYIKTAKELSDA